MRNTIFNVPILPYLKKFAVKQYFKGQQPPYKIELNTPIGKKFLTAVVVKRYDDVPGDKKIEMSAYLQVELCNAIAERKLSLGILASINLYLDQDFKDHLITWVCAADSCGIRALPATYSFLEHYGIKDNEYSQDAAYKYYYRWKNKEFNKNKKVLASKKIGGIVQPLAGATI